MGRPSITIQLEIYPLAGGLIQAGSSEKMLLYQSIGIFDDASLDPALTLTSVNPGSLGSGQLSANPIPASLWSIKQGGTAAVRHVSSVWSRILQLSFEPR